ncbi:hypothetical protein X777_15417, partial [Ooceraea biroi]
WTDEIAGRIVITVRVQHTVRRVNVLRSQDRLPVEFPLFGGSGSGEFLLSEESEASDPDGSIPHWRNSIGSTFTSISSMLGV